MARDLDIYNTPRGKSGKYQGLLHAGSLARKQNHDGRESVWLNYNKENSVNAHSRCIGAAIALIERAGLMLENAETTIEHQAQRIGRLEELLTTDELTGLKNRRGFFDSFVRELDRCDRGLSKGGLIILIELDNLRAINEEQGVAAGDSCLRLMARTLIHDIRVMDVAARLKTDEFALLFSNSGKREAALRAEDLMRTFGKLSMVWNGEEFPVQASLALQSYRKGDHAAGIISAAYEVLQQEREMRRKIQDKGGEKDNACLSP